MGDDIRNNSSTMAAILYILAITIVLAGCVPHSSPTLISGEPATGTSPAATTNLPDAASLSATPAKTPSPLLSSCSQQLSAQDVNFSGPQGEQLRGALIGDGTTGVLISNQSGNQVCQWTSFIPSLLDAHFKVMVYEYGSGARVDEAAAAVAFLSQQGLRRIILMGGSQGAEVTVVLAGKNLHGVVAAVSLSVDRSLNVNTDSFAAQIKIPILFVAAKDDPFGSNITSPKLHSLATTPDQDKQLVIVPGEAHGYQLLSDPTVQTQVLKFMESHQ